MQKPKYLIMSLLVLGAYLVSACSGATPAPAVVEDSSNGQFQEIVFTGIVESMDGGQWQINGEVVSVDAVTSVDGNIQVGDRVKVEASVSSDGTVIALRIESSSSDDNANSNDANTNDDTANTNDNTNADNSNSNANSNDTSAGGTKTDTVGVVDAITDSTVTIDGVTYNLADFTEFKDLISAGDQVKIHIIVNSDGTLTIREIEKSDGTSIGDDNSNSNNNDDDSNSNHNSNDDDDDDHNSNDDDSHDDDNSNANSNDHDDD